MKAFSPLTRLFAALTLVIAGAIGGQAQQPPAPASTTSEIAPLRVTVLGEVAGQPGWKRYRFGDQFSFDGAFPGEPKYQSEQFPASKGAHASRLYLAPSSTGIYGINYIESQLGTTSGISDAEAKQFFDGYINGFLNGFKNGMESKGMMGLETRKSAERRIRISGIEGYEQDISVGPFEGRTQVVVVGRKIYAAFALWNTDNPQSERAAFFNSFQIGARR